MVDSVRLHFSVVGFVYHGLVHDQSWLPYPLLLHVMPCLVL